MIGHKCIMTQNGVGRKRVPEPNLGLGRDALLPKLELGEGMPCPNLGLGASMSWPNAKLDVKKDIILFFVVIFVWWLLNEKVFLENHDPSICLSNKLNLKCVFIDFNQALSQEFEIKIYIKNCFLSQVAWSFNIFI